MTVRAISWTKNRRSRRKFAVETVPAAVCVLSGNLDLIYILPFGDVELIFSLAFSLSLSRSLSATLNSNYFGTYTM
ncbi:hypothetical protein KFK09_002701 [Dendrobium nobile]|uniref:Uncharacterized protein n=1 Tax=Dendrobium nobile TaxID=94219 RepID=A0A8T3C7Z6_DENNO|nr:hypothetical protein KFK09_002701 [Dendrobium nobile]